MSELKQVIYFRQTSPLGPWYECEAGDIGAVAFVRRTQPEATKPVQDLSAAILALPLPGGSAASTFGAEEHVYSAWQMRELLKAAAALSPPAQALSAVDSETVKDAITDTQRIDHIEAWSANNKARGMHWNTFCFDVDSTVRDQLDAAILQSQGAKNG